MLSMLSVQESVLSCFGAGKSYSLVVDLGATKTHVSCVDDGLIMPRSRYRLGLRRVVIQLQMQTFYLLENVPFVFITFISNIIWYRQLLPYGGDDISEYILWLLRRFHTAGKNDVFHCMRWCMWCVLHLVIVYYPNKFFVRVFISQFGSISCHWRWASHCVFISDFVQRPWSRPPLLRRYQFSTDFLLWTCLHSTHSVSPKFLPWLIS